MPSGHSAFLDELLKRVGKVSTAALVLLAQNSVEAAPSDLANVLCARVASAVAIDRSENKSGVLQTPLILTPPNAGSKIQLAGHRSHRSHSSHRSHTSGMGGSAARAAESKPSPPDRAGSTSRAPTSGSRTKSTSIGQRNLGGGSTANKLRPESEVEPEITGTTDRTFSEESTGSDLPNRLMDRPSHSGNSLSGSNRSAKPSDSATRQRTSAAQIEGRKQLQAEADDPALQGSHIEDRTNGPGKLPTGTIADQPTINKSRTGSNPETTSPARAAKPSKTELTPEERFEVLSIAFVDGKAFARVLDTQTAKKHLVGLGEKINKLTVTRIDVDEMIVELSAGNEKFTLTAKSLNKGRR